jgi:hypothetical protein
MQFWQLTHPHYESDYRDSYVNGKLVHPFGLPGVHCDICHQTWGGSRILPFQCPDSLRRRKHLREGWPVPLEQHKVLQREVHDEFSRHGTTLPPLRPGDDFQPCYLDIPSRPQADFLWCALGSVVVSDKVRRAFDAWNIVAGITFCPVTLRKIGKMDATLPVPIPSSGEPEDVIGEVPLLSRTDTVGRYFELLVQTESAPPPGGEPISICAGCGRETIDDAQRRLIMHPSMWRRVPIFHLATTLHIIITDELKCGLQELRCTNVDFRPYPAV